MVGFALISVAGGVTDLLVGKWDGVGVFVANPLEGTISNPYPVEYQIRPAGSLEPSVYGTVDFQLGEDDQISGQRALILNCAQSDLSVSCSTRTGSWGQTHR